MRILSGNEAKLAEGYLSAALAEAERAICARARCGSVVVSEGEIIGRGFNSPPRGLESQARCRRDKAEYDPKVTDKTCCVHAEVRAILDALRHFPDRLSGSTLYFSRFSASGLPEPAGEPYCTLCSKLALDAGIATFVLQHTSGATAYGTEEYNDRSFAYREASIDKDSESI